MTARGSWLALLLLGSLAIGVSSVLARTIELTDLESDRMAMISPAAPLSSWAMTELGPGEYTTTLLDLRTERSFLIRFPLDRIPAGQRIARAEWIVPVDLILANSEVKLHVHRVLAEWGPGVSHEYRMTRPKPVKWNQPGAKGVSTDHALQPTAIVNVANPGELTINVTEDVELWYTGAAANNGWIVTVDSPGALVRMGSPLWTGQGRYKLRITYEPE